MLEQIWVRRYLFGLLIAYHLNIFPGIEDNMVTIALVFL